MPQKMFRILKKTGLILLGSAMVVFWFWLYLYVFHFELPKTVMLRRNNLEWQAKMDVIDSRLDRCEVALGGIEDRNDDVYRSIFGMNPIPRELKFSGLGGRNRYSFLDEEDASQALKAVSLRADTLLKRAYVQTKALDEVGVNSKKAGDMVSCIPAVPPILPKKGSYHISSPFGYRADPIHGYGRFHEGIDLASDRGNPVYATGNGVVVKVDFKFTGYGNEVVIDHGFGYKTRFAHLSTVCVGLGQHLCRGDQIGELGNSGKSTGPHLHYEVLYKGAPVNPFNFMDLGMTVEEYEAMTAGRRQATGSSQPSYDDILKRGRRNGQ